MKRALALLAVFMMVTVACSDSGEETTPATSADTVASTPATSAGTVATTPPGTEPAAAGSVADIAITEVVFGDHVTITNTGSGDVSIDGLWLCNRPSYTPLPSQTLAPGESVEIAASGLSSLSDSGGEAALYTSNSFGDSGAIIDYVSWGSGGGRASVAAAAGIWPEGETVAPAGASISAPGGGSSAADWSG